MWGHPQNMERTSLNKNITIKKIFEGGNPPVHALWKFVYQVAEFGTLAQCLTLAVSMRNCPGKLHEVDKLLKIKFYHFEMKDPFISVYTMTQRRGGGGGGGGEEDLQWCKSAFSDKLDLHKKGVFWWQIMLKRGNCSKRFVKNWVFQW